MIRVTHSIEIDESELHFDFVRSSGPGGQNVNKVSTAVQLRFDVGSSMSLRPEVKARLMQLAGSRLTTGGVIVIDARRTRSQSLNRQEAVDRLVELIRQASVRPKVRRPTSPTRGSQLRRMEAKRHRSQRKQERRPGEPD